MQVCNDIPTVVFLKMFPKWYTYVCIYRERGGSRYKVPGPGSPEGSRGPTMLHTFFVFLSSIIICRLYILTLSDQAQVTATESQSFGFSVKIFSLAGLGVRKHFSPGPEPTLGGPDRDCFQQ
jgi:hypothetical protein